jgi:hypothetical protein
VSIGIWELLILSALFSIFVFGTIAKKAGFSRWFGLLMLVPLVNIVFIWIFAFMKWPAVDRTRTVDTHRFK